jgi:hypothetical protein
MQAVQHGTRPDRTGHWSPSRFRRLQLSEHLLSAVRTEAPHVTHGPASAEPLLEHPSERELQSGRGGRDTLPLPGESHPLAVGSYDDHDAPEPIGCQRAKLQPAPPPVKRPRLKRYFNDE